MTKFISTKRQPIGSIVGKTIIIHNIRHKLKISCDEYVLLDYLYTREQRKPGQRITYGSLAHHTGFAESDLIILWPLLKERGLVARCEKTKNVRTTEKWNDLFLMEKESFEIFWTVYGRIESKAIGSIGNKAKASEMYKKALKIADAETLLESAKTYTKYCHETGTFIKNCSSWLNPTYQYWDDILPSVIKKEDAKIIINEVNNFMHGAKK